MPLSEEERRKLSKRMMGNTYGLGRTHEMSENGRRAVSRASTGNTYAAGHTHTLSKEHKRAISERSQGNKSRTGQTISEDHKRAISKASRGNTHTLGRLRSEEERQQLSRSQKAAWAAKSQKERDEWVRNGMLGNKRRPSEPEWLLGLFLERHFPGEWAYNGDGNQGVIIGRRVPDFININGAKAVIEVFGEYWHDEEEVQPKIDHYARFGFNCLVLWDYEIPSEGLIQRISKLAQIKKIEELYGRL